MGKAPNELVPGTLDLLILTALGDSKMHGYELMDCIWNSSGELFRVDEGALYPALHRLEAKGCLASEWGVSAANRKAKYYWLTARGKKALAGARSDWNRLVLGMSRALGEA
jgi:PadR family transcriptional regulator, regulatory protein PadR